MTAKITWNGEAKDYRIGSVTFKQNKTETVTDPHLVDYCRSTLGFSVTVVPDAPAKKAPAPPPVQAEEPTAEPDERSARGKR